MICEKQIKKFVKV